MTAQLIATFHSSNPVTLSDGDQVLVEVESGEVTARRVPRFFSEDPIHGFGELSASLEGEIVRRRGRIGDAMARSRRNLARLRRRQP